MRTCARSVFGGIGLVALSAAAQGQAVLTHEWTWREVHAGTTTPVTNSNGLLEPGEGILLELTVSFDPPVGSPYPVPGAPQAVIAGFGGHLIYMEGRGPGLTMNHGVFSHVAGRQGWTFMHGEPVPGIAIVNNIMFGQPFPPVNVNPLNPIEQMWRGVFTPDSYHQRDIRFLSGSATFPGVGWYIILLTGYDPQTNDPQYMFQSVTGPYAQIHLAAIVRVVPAPGGPAAIVVLGAALARRRRA